jgi:diguanylate cyclase (GGDEF)-like protein
MILLDEDFDTAKAQKLRLNRVYAAIFVSTAFLVWLAAGTLVEQVSWNAVAWSTVWVAICAFAAIISIQTHANLRLKDPSLTRALVLAGASCIVANSLLLDAAGTNILSIAVLLTFAFAALTGSTRFLLQLSAGIILMMLSAQLYRLRESVDLSVMLWHTTIPVATLLMLAVYAGRMNQAKEASRNKLALANITIRAMNDAVINLDAKGRIIDLNPAACALLNWRAPEAAHSQFAQTLQSLALNRYDPDVVRFLAQCCGELTFSSNEVLRCHFHLQAGNRSQPRARHVEAVLKPVLDAGKHLVGQLVVMKDVTEHYALLERLEHDSTHDSMTGLLNRRGLEQALDRLQQTLPDAHAKVQTVIAVLDLDNLKIVNDTCGHSAGDHLIQKISQLLLSKLQAQDVFARYGGDEFALLLSNRTETQARQLFDNMLHCIREMNFSWEGKKFRTGASVGAVVVDIKTFEGHESLFKADSALYLAKELGKGRVQFHHPGDEQVARKDRQLGWAWRINNALENNLFDLFAQKIVSFNPQVEDHWEVLLRLRDEEGSLISPISFLPSAERFDLMPAIDRWVISQSLERMSRAQSLGMHIPKIAINISAQSLREQGFLEFVEQAVLCCPVPSHRISFELTETVAIQSVATAENFIQRIRALGCEFQLDDVGAGFNSFSYLKTLKFDAIKIDGHYIRDITSNGVNRKLVDSLVRAADSLGLKTIAEMVETDAVAQQLREMGVAHMQGYHFHRPEPFLTAALKRATVEQEQERASSALS